LQDIHEGVEFSFNLRRLTGLGYYDGPCFHIKMTNDRGESFMLADGGFVQWTQRLLGDKKERLLTSAIGIELLCRLFRVEGDTAI
jgi:histidyl-tRNA synthetase